MICTVYLSLINVIEWTCVFVVKVLPCLSLFRVCWSNQPTSSQTPPPKHIQNWLHFQTRQLYLSFLSVTSSKVRLQKAQFHQSLEYKKRHRMLSYTVIPAFLKATTWVHCCAYFGPWIYHQLDTNSR